VVNVTQDQHIGFRSLGGNQLRKWFKVSFGIINLPINCVRVRFRSTIQSTKTVVLRDFSGLRRSPRACKSCHGRGRGFEPRRPRPHSKAVRRISLKPSRAQKGHVPRPFCAPFQRPAVSYPATSAPSDLSEEKTSDITAACAACFAGVTACV